MTAAVTTDVTDIPPDRQIILVDGSSFLFRAYHAIRQPLATSDGRKPPTPCSAPSTCCAAWPAQYQPQHLAVVMDAKGKDLPQ